MKKIANTHYKCLHLRSFQLLTANKSSLLYVNIGPDNYVNSGLYYNSISMKRGGVWDVTRQVDTHG